MAGIANPYERYREQGVMTAGPVDLVIMLYDGCIKQLKLATLHMEENSIDKSHNALMRAQDIVTELLHGLDLQYDIAQQLMRLYDFILHEIINADMKKDPAPLVPVLEMLGDLRGAWVEVGKANRTAYAILE